MKKVLIVFNHPAPYKVRLFNELSKNFDLHVIFERKSESNRNKNFYFEQKYNFIEHKIKGLPLGKEGVLSAGVKNHIKENHYDLVIMNGYSHLAEMKAIRYMNRHHIPFALYVNGGIIPKKELKLKKHLKTKYISSAKYYFSPDNESNNYLVYYGAKREKILSYPYSTIFDHEIVTEKINKIELREKLGLQFENLLVSAGQLIKRKNYFSLVKEWKNYPENFGLLIMGDGNEKAKIENFIQENHMKNVVLTGFLKRDEMFNYMRCGDAFLFPSNEDIYGHVVNESLSQGLPVISSKHVNSSIKLIKNRENGFLINKFSGAELKESIEYCLQNDMFETCVEVAKQNTIEKMAEAHVKMFEEAMK